MSNDFGGINDPSNGQGAVPSYATAFKGTFAPLPTALPDSGNVPLIGSPIIGTPVVTDTLQLKEWRIYSQDNKLWASNGTHNLQFVLVNPAGLVQSTNAPNKLSDGSDGSSGSSLGNTAVTGRTVSATGGASTAAGIPTFNNITYGNTSTDVPPPESSAGGSSASGSTSGGGTGIVNQAISAYGSLGIGPLNNTPCLPPDISNMLSGLTPGGLTALVMDLSKQTQELTNMTKMISTLLPGLPYSATGTILSQLTKGIKGITSGLSSIKGELTGGLSNITSELGCITQDLTAISSSITSTIGSLSNQSFISSLPNNLSVDSLISQLSSTNSQLNAGVSAINSFNNSLGSLGTVGPLSTTTQIIQPGITNTTVTTTSMQMAGAELEFLVNGVYKLTNFSSSVSTGFQTVQQYLGKPISVTDWNHLIAAAHAVSGSDLTEYVWAIGTILNRSRLTGLSVTDILKQPGQFTAIISFLDNTWSEKFINGPAFDQEYIINDLIVKDLNSIPKNNYYFDSAIGKTAAKRSGVDGILIGQSFVYPGAKWP